MARKRVTHIRRLNLVGTMSHLDVLRICDEIKQLFPETVFFAPRTFDAKCREPGDKKWKQEQRISIDPVTQYNDAASCFAALIKEQQAFARTPAVRIAFRAPWPDEIGAVDPISLLGPGHDTFPSLEDDSLEKWRRAGRFAEITVPAKSPVTVLAVDSPKNRRLLEPQTIDIPKILARLPKSTPRLEGASEPLPNGSTPVQANPQFSREVFGQAEEVDTTSQFGEVESWYNASDADISHFFDAIQSAFSRQLTTRIAYYDPATGRFLDRHRGRYKQHIGRDLLRWLCHHPNVFEGITHLDGDNPGFEGRLAAHGPAPDFRAEVFLAEGLPIDNIDGLTIAEGDRLNRRFEKQAKAARKPSRI